ncbi:unnamed protein product [Callosobruchus maculatus]|uniref:Peptidase S1 domain-containing protein n=1 Tax=Callosobruchus maculatus TaxID=64391 RepID=A0A653DFX6_CALMS|nr:unnamed protein product [Callosobruchus maculatus]
MKIYIIFFCALRSIVGHRHRDMIPTIIEKAPWQVSVEYDGAFRCGAALLTPSWVVTVASCLVNMPNAHNVTVRAGSSFVGIGGQTRGVDHIHIHDSYGTGGQANDIGLLFLRKAFSGDITMKTLKLPHSEEQEFLQFPFTDHKRILTTGWSTGSKHGQLVQMHFPLVPWLHCNILYFGAKKVHLDQFCVGFQQENVCREDLGSPAVKDDRLLGLLVSGCDSDPKKPAIYTSVPSHVQWIKDTLLF